MAKRFYPAVLERGTKETFGVWFPDFPGCVAGGRSQEDAIAKAERALSQAVEGLSEKERSLPEPTPFEKVALPKDARFVAFFAVGVEPPDPSERVNIYLPKSLLARADSAATQLGMSRSSLFGLAVSMLIRSRFSALLSGVTLASTAGVPRAKAEDLILLKTKKRR
jgi:predicted RNase H-like HicB family nuclease